MSTPIGTPIQYFVFDPSERTPGHILAGIIVAHRGVACDPNDPDVVGVARVFVPSHLRGLCAGDIGSHDHEVLLVKYHETQTTPTEPGQWRVVGETSS